jgi:hypothetical protein
MEIWFYQSPSLALPSYFNLLFYKRSIGEPYSLYSPLSDGPARLVSSLEALNDQKKSLDILRKSLGDEVATTALSLIPGESVNFDDYAPNMSSDLLLNMIAGLPDNPLTQEELNLNRLREHVTMSLVMEGQEVVNSYNVFRDEQGRETLNYLMRFMLPDPKIVAQREDGSFHYDLTLRTTVTTADNKPVYDQEDFLTGNLAEAQAEIAKKKDFAAEARLPLAPGKYTIIATLTNNLDKIETACECHRTRGRRPEHSHLQSVGLCRACSRERSAWRVALQHCRTALHAARGAERPHTPGRAAAAGLSVVARSQDNRSATLGEDPPPLRVWFHCCFPRRGFAGG